MNEMNAPKLQKIVVLLVAVLISAIFLSMIRQFLLTILLAAIFAGLQIPLFKRFQRWFGGRRNLSAALTLVVLLFIVFLPLAAILGIVAVQAVSISSTAIPWIRAQLDASGGGLHGFFTSLPVYSQLQKYSDLILQKAGEAIGGLGSELFSRISSFTYSAVYDLFLFFILLYTMFFFLKDGEEMLEEVKYCLPLDRASQNRLFDRFLSVTRATLKGTLVVGLVQGGLGGLGFWVAGIDSAVFWGTAMAMLSILPLIGPLLVWLPAVIILGASGHYAQAVGLFLFCSIVVGQSDNIIRPILVGRDTQMHELFIFFGTLGGIALFGIFGFIVGPVIAALFVTVWEIYGETFSENLDHIRQGTGGVKAGHDDGGGPTKP